MPTPTSPGSILIDRELRDLSGLAIRTLEGGLAIEPAQFQPASMDLRLGKRAWAMRAGFLPTGGSIEDHRNQLEDGVVDLEGDGARLERGRVYLVELEESLALPSDVSARFNPRSSTGRCDLFTRVLSAGHSRFDEAPAGYRGPLFLEICPLSFSVHLRRGDRLCQVRLQRGDPGLSTEELKQVYRETPLAFEGDRALGEQEVRFGEQGDLLLSVGLDNRDPAGWRSRSNSPLLRFAEQGTHDPQAFWDPVRAQEGRCILDPGHFYIFASHERIRIPAHLAAEMLPVDVGIGELRNNYAGFFDNGFGWQEDEQGTPVGSGTPAVLEVRAHDVPFQVEHGQTFFRLRFFRTSGRPDALYGEGRLGASYRGQDLTLARCFKRD
ncbi:MAG: dCTP deaminase [Glaciecola sp.]|jgi:dCTP deaminase